MLPRQRPRTIPPRVIDVEKANKSKKVVAYVVAFEVLSLAAFWLGFNRLNNSSDTRRTLQKYWPSALEGYYHITDTIAGNNLREEDRKIWAGSDSWVEDGSS